jgi:hypothetical protein
LRAFQGKPPARRGWPTRQARRSHRPKGLPEKARQRRQPGGCGPDAPTLPRVAGRRLKARLAWRRLMGCPDRRRDRSGHRTRRPGVPSWSLEIAPAIRPAGVRDSRSTGRYPPAPSAAHQAMMLSTLRRHPSSRRERRSALPEVPRQPRRSQPALPPEAIPHRPGAAPADRA